jgi:aminopeptidase N
MIPSAEAKADTFHRLITDDTVPNALVRAATLGYTHVGDPSVLADLVTTYFDALDTIWESRSYKMAEYLVEGLFPSPLASAALEDACVKWLNEHEGPAALRRMVEENLAGVIRARKAQQRDLSAA